MKKFKIEWLDDQGNAANLGLDEIIEVPDNWGIVDVIDAAEYYFFLDRGETPEGSPYKVQITKIL